MDGNVSLPSDNFPSVTSMHVDSISQKPSVLVIEQNHQDVCIITADDDPSLGGCQVNDMEDTTPELVTNLTVSPLANHPANMLVLFCFSRAGALAAIVSHTNGDRAALFAEPFRKSR